MVQEVGTGFNVIDYITPIRYPNRAEATVILNGNSTFKGITGSRWIMAY